uniref:Uncharacterized protein n=1 Tax=Anopheles atroparvus TaxID=41427 RepID=A0AAG5DPA1_ANOAO
MHLWKNFRVSPESFLAILQEIDHKFPPVRTSWGLTVKDKLVSTLRFLAEGSYQHGVGQDFNQAIAQPSFHNFQANVTNFGGCSMLEMDKLGYGWRRTADSLFIHCNFLSLDQKKSFRGQH